MKETGRRKGGEMARPPAQRFEDLLVWQKSHALVLRVYQATRKFPREETCGLTAQCRRAVVSVPANIAEGFKKRGRADKARFMNVAEASLEEARYYFVLAQDLGYQTDSKLAAEFDEVARMLSAYADSILRSAQQPA
jgi:four helix bundle protein